MAQSYQQTDTGVPTVCSAAAFCSGASVNTDVDANKQASVGGTAGSTPITVTVDGNATGVACVWWECIIPAGSTWSAGNWTVRYNVTSGNHQITLQAIYLCRVNSGCTNQATLGSLTSIGENWSSAQTYTHTVNQGSLASPSAGDKVIIVALFDNGNSMGQDIIITPSLLIDSPYLSAVTTQEQMAAISTVNTVPFNYRQFIPVSSGSKLGGGTSGE